MILLSLSKYPAQPAMGSEMDRARGRATIVETAKAVLRA
jgi:hypothetical protein